MFGWILFATLHKTFPSWSQSPNSAEPCRSPDSCSIHRATSDWLLLVPVPVGLGLDAACGGGETGRPPCATAALGFEGAACAALGLGDAGAGAAGLGEGGAAGLGEAGAGAAGLGEDGAAGLGEAGAGAAGLGEGGAGDLSRPFIKPASSPAMRCCVTPARTSVSISRRKPVSRVAVCFSRAVSETAAVCATPRYGPLKAGALVRMALPKLYMHWHTDFKFFCSYKSTVENTSFSSTPSARQA